MALQLAFVLVTIIIGARVGAAVRDRSGNSDVWFRIAAYITSH